MRAVRSMLLCGVASVVFTGCATHPLPEDVTRVRTFDIIQRVRCEAREAVSGQLSAQLLRSSVADSRRVGVAIQSGALEVADFVERYDAGLISTDKTTRERIKNYRGAAIAMAFTFDITENNKGSSSFGFRDPLFNGLFDLKFSSGADLTRRNERKVEIGDKFETLLIDDKLQTYCLKVDYSQTTPFYPVVGSIGLYEVIDTFLRVEQNVGLAGTLADTLEFETKIHGSSNPKITLSPLGKSLQLVEAGGTVSAERRDIHRVIVTVKPVRKKVKADPIEVSIVSLPGSPGTQQFGSPTPPGVAAPTPEDTTLRDALDAARRESAAEELSDAIDERFRRILEDLQ